MLWYAYFKKKTKHKQKFLSAWNLFFLFDRLYIN